jgi:type IV pilus assembly protein PilY1
VPAAQARNLYSWNGAAPVRFTWPTVSADRALLQQIGDLASESLIDYIRGDSTNAGAGKAYRARTGPLPDFIDSAPVFVQGTLDLSYDRLPGAAGPAYRAYVQRKKARADGVVWLGGNGGLLHAFRASDGAELFGYLPFSSLAGLPQLASPDYGTATNFHHFFVDGPTVEADAYIATRRNAAPDWANLLLGALGAGGTGLFALHLPTDDATALDGQTVLWERSARDDADLGHVYAVPQVGRMPGGGPWVAIVGNGAYSAEGRAALLVIDLATGAVLKKLVVAAGGPGAADASGVMGVSLLRNANREVVGAYAGDLQGRLWRFDFKGPGPADWVVGFKGRPLFEAADASGRPQALTAAPTSLPHAQVGNIVLFGTGRLLELADADDAAPQTFYGVWDPTPAGVASDSTDSPFAAAARDRDTLAVRVIDPHPVSTAAGMYYNVTAEAFEGGRRSGWLMDLPFTGARVIDAPQVVGEFVSLDGLVPAAAASACNEGTAASYRFVLPARDGVPVASAVLDTNGDGLVDAHDLSAAGFQTVADGSDALVMANSPDGEMVFESTGSGGQRFKAACVSRCSARIVDRVWKQIVTPPAP